MKKFFRWFGIQLCGWHGHKVYLEDMGGTHLQCCKNCSWTGRTTYDVFATPEEKEKIVALNKKYGVLG